MTNKKFTNHRLHLNENKWEEIKIIYMTSWQPTTRKNLTNKC